MKTLVEPQDEANKVKLTVEIPEAEFEPAIEAAFRKIAREVNIPGFRPGKAPRRILEQRIGKGYARAQAIEDGLPEFYAKAVTENAVDVISQPELELTGGVEEGPVTFTALVETRPKLRVPGYDGLQVTVPTPDVTDEELDAQVDRLRERFAALNTVDRPAANGDHVTVDVNGTVAGEAIPDLQASDYSYQVGAGTIVAEFDAALRGATAGQDLTFIAPIPGAPDDADPIEFAVHVQNVQERVLPEADDDFAKTSSEFTTLAELRADIAKRMAGVKRMQTVMALRDETVKALVELADGDTPETLVNQEIGRRLDDLAHRLSHQGATLAQYLEATGQGEQQLLDQLRPEAEQAVRSDLSLRAVVEAEAIEASDADVDTEIKRLANQYKMKPAKVRSNLEKSYQMPLLRTDIAKAKALTWLTEHATVVDADGKVIDREKLVFAPGEIDPLSTVDLDDDDHEGHDHD